MKKLFIKAFTFSLLMISLSYKVTAAEMLKLRINTDANCDVDIVISEDEKTESLLSKITEKYSGFNITDVKYNSVSLQGGKTLKEQNIKSSGNIYVASNVIHIFEDKGITKMPTCVENGEKTKVCKLCGIRLKESINSLGHALSEPEVVAKTCTKDGYTLRKCIRCNYTEKTNVVKAGHVYTVWKIVKEPTCTEEGETVRTCIKCGKEEKAKISKTEHEIIEEIIEPTCTKVGYIIHKCSANCGYVEDKQEIYPTGHNLTEWMITQKPTLMEEGQKIRKCKNKDCNYYETEKIASLASGGNQELAVDEIVQELKKKENSGKLALIASIILLPVIFVFFRDVYLAEKNQINKKKQKIKEEKKKEKEVKNIEILELKNKKNKK